MHVRLATEDDIDEVLAMTQEAMAEVRPWLKYDEAETRDTFTRYLDTAEPTIFVAEHRGAIVGGAVGSIQQYRTASGHFVLHEVLFVRPGSRGTRAAASLMKHLVAWSEMLGAKEIVGGNDSGMKSEKVARFLSNFGFEHVGYSMRRVL
jgi:L-amino acid N-acyltransferase YncA